MLLYHGSNVIVSEPRLVPQKRFLDFGFGFYTTTNSHQAVSFAEKVFRRRREGAQVVNVYEIHEETAFSECSVLRFDKPDEAWLDFVSQNRAGRYAGEKYDLIFGPVANDDVYTTFNLYVTGVLSKEQTLEALKIKKVYNQLVFSSQKSLQYLHFIRILSKEEMEWTSKNSTR